MKILITGRHIDNIKSLFSGYKDIEIVNESPDVVVTHGGDGALLGAEYAYPGIPKLPVRDTATAPLCEKHSSIADLLELFMKGSLAETRLIKIAGFIKDKQVTGINDVFIHNVDRAGALRYRVMLDDEPYGNEIIGDGVGVSTVHGSTAYYRSITHSIFKIGIGLAFSNSTEVTNHLVLPEETVVKVEIARGPAILLADNMPEQIPLDKGDSVVIRKIPDTALIYGLDIFMCDECRKLRHPVN